MIVLVLMSFSQLVCKQGQVVNPGTILGKEWFSALTNPGNSNMDPELMGNLSFASSPSPSPTCNSECHCTSSQNLPVCYAEKDLVFPSACHAGCTTYDPVSQVYTNCSCLPSLNIELKPGKCVNPDSCYNTFLVFLALMAMVRFGGSFGRIGNVLIPYRYNLLMWLNPSVIIFWLGSTSCYNLPLCWINRCVDQSQKSLASGLSFVMWSIVSIPSPIMYGKIIGKKYVL